MYKREATVEGFVYSGQGDAVEAVMRLRQLESDDGVLLCGCKQRIGSCESTGVVRYKSTKRNPPKLPRADVMKREREIQYESGIMQKRMNTTRYP